MVETWEGRGMRLILAEESTVQFSEVAQLFIAAFNRASYAESETTTEKTTDKEPSSTAKKILKLIALNPVITQKELAVKLGLTEDGVYYHIARLKRIGQLIRIGGKKAGRWEVKK
jgi:ATP-dependent DNA helicase RecG